MASHSEVNKSGFATAGLVLGIVGVCTAFIPIINNLSFFMGILAFIFGIIAFMKKCGKGKVIASIILGILAIVITLSAQKSASDALDAVSKELDKATGGSTEEVLKNDVDVTFGNFEVIEGDYGINDTKLMVKITNKTNETKSFNFQIEAVDSNGTRITQDYIYANNLSAGQSQEFETFNFVETDKIESLKNAQFKVVQASVY